MSLPGGSSGLHGLHVTTYTVDDGVALVTLNRPERLNAWTGRMEREYRWCLAEADDDRSVRVVVVTGAGRGFCAGADFQAIDDISETGRYDDGRGDEPLPQPGRGVRADFEGVHTFPLGLAKPLIAAINGPAAGVGFVLACFADLRFAASGAKLTTSFARLGLGAEHGVAWILPRIVGSARAADLLFSSRVVLAEEAERMGLVNRVYEASDLLPETLRYARTMAAECSPSSLRTIKRQLYADLLDDLGTAAHRDVQLMEAMVSEPDFIEAARARRERRAPVFDGLSPLDGAAPSDSPLT